MEKQGTEAGDYYNNLTIKLNAADFFKLLFI